MNAANATQVNLCSPWRTALAMTTAGLLLAVLLPFAMRNVHKYAIALASVNAGRPPSDTVAANDQLQRPIDLRGRAIELYTNIAVFASAAALYCLGMRIADWPWSQRGWNTEWLIIGVLIAAGFGAAGAWLGTHLKFVHWSRNPDFALPSHLVICFQSACWTLLGLGVGMGGAIGTRRPFVAILLAGAVGGLAYGALLPMLVSFVFPEIDSDHLAPLDGMESVAFASLWFGSAGALLGFILGGVKWTETARVRDNPPETHTVRTEVGSE